MGRQIIHDFVVVDELISDAILGIDFIHRNGHEMRIRGSNSEPIKD